MSVFRRLPLWPLWLLGLVPIAAFLLFASSGGRSLIARLTHGPDHWALPGITVEAEPPPGHGLVVTSLQSGSEAARSGIVVGDVIVTVDGQPIHRTDELARYLAGDGQDAVTLQVEHRSARRSLRLHLAMLPAEAGFLV